MIGVLATFKMGICTIRSILAKNFAYLFHLDVTMDALEPFRTKGPKQEPTHFPTQQKENILLIST
jgi:hypothetical protein